MRYLVLLMLVGCNVARAERRPEPSFSPVAAMYACKQLHRGDCSVVRPSHGAQSAARFRDGTVLGFGDRRSCDAAGGYKNCQAGIAVLTLNDDTALRRTVDSF